MAEISPLLTEIEAQFVETAKPTEKTDTGMVRAIELLSKKRLATLKNRVERDEALLALRRIRQDEQYVLRTFANYVQDGWGVFPLGATLKTTELSNVTPVLVRLLRLRNAHNPEALAEISALQNPEDTPEYELVIDIGKKPNGLAYLRSVRIRKSAPAEAKFEDESDWQWEACESENCEA